MLLRLKFLVILNAQSRYIRFLPYVMLILNVYLASEHLRQSPEKSKWQHKVWDKRDIPERFPTRKVCKLMPHLTLVHVQCLSYKQNWKMLCRGKLNQCWMGWNLSFLSSTDLTAGCFYCLHFNFSCIWRLLRKKENLGKSCAYTSCLTEKAL